MNSVFLIAMRLSFEQQMAEIPVAATSGSWVLMFPLKLPRDLPHRGTFASLPQGILKVAEGCFARAVGASVPLAPHTVDSAPGTVP